MFEIHSIRNDRWRKHIVQRLPSSAFFISRVKQKLFFFSLCFFCCICSAQQIPDTNYTYSNDLPAYPAGEGPIIVIDAAHNNFHTAEDGLIPLVKLLNGDGYRCRSNDKPFDDPSSTEQADLLIVVNALHEDNLNHWVRPNPSAFTEEEIKSLKNWVSSGGHLLLIADHMPFAGAANTLAKAFGFHFLNGFARMGQSFWPPDEFNRELGTLSDHPVTRGGSIRDSIERILTFTGSAFTVPKQAHPILSFDSSASILLPDTAWNFNSKTPVQGLDRHYQGAVSSYGKGKVAVFGEAAMFTAQLIQDGQIKAGFNSDRPNDNAPFILNLVHWLIEETDSGILKDSLSALLQHQFQKMVQTLLSEHPGELSRFYTEDARIISRGVNIQGRPAIRAYWSAMKDRAFSWTLEQEDLRISNDLLVQTGTSDLEYRNDSGKRVHSVVRFTLVWRETPEGWKIAIDHYSAI